MAIIELRGIEGKNAQEILDALERQRKELEYFLEHIDDENITGLSVAKLIQASNFYTTPLFGTGWSQWGAGGPVGYTKNAFNEVRFKGCVVGTGSVNGTTVFTVPSKMCPAYPRYFSVPSGVDGLQPAYIKVDYNGAVTIRGTDLSWVALDSISYDV